MNGSSLHPGADSLAEALLDASSFPRRMTIETSSVCNLSCIMCPRKYLTGTNGFMSMALFNKILGEINVHEIEAIVPFFRGEPLLHPQFLEMMLLLRKKTRARIQIATNGLLLSPVVIRALLNLQIDFISFSLDAATKETYEKIRHGGSFDRAMENIHAFLKMRETLSASATIVQVSATENSYNETEIPAFIAYWTGRVDRVRIYARHSDNGNYGKLANPGHRRPDASRGPCRKPFTDLVIYYDGQVALCNHDWDRQGNEAIGSLENRCIEDIWKGQAYQQIRDKHLRGSWNELSPCSHCDHWQAREENESPVGALVAGLSG